MKDIKKVTNIKKLTENYFQVMLENNIKIVLYKRYNNFIDDNLKLNEILENNVLIYQNKKFDSKKEFKNFILNY